jgi:beta-lactamase regulating signal transducer with metallopeptidase domain
MLLLVLVIFFVFRVKNPATRFLFLLLPLIKPFIILLDNPSEMRLAQADKTVQIAARLPDPLNLFKAPILEAADFIYDGSTLVIIFLMTAALVFAVIATRWLQLYLFLNGFKNKEALSRTAYPHVYEILDTLVPKLGVAYPRVIVSNNYQFVPFSVGYRMPIVVVSEELLASFPSKQLEIMLAHELAHMLRKDNLTGWLALILRDIMFFNPIVRLVYNKIEDEKEKTCDKIALDVTGASSNIAANMLIDVALFYQTVSIAHPQAYPALAKGLIKRQSRVEHRINSITRAMHDKKSFFARTSLSIIIFVLLLYFQIGFHLDISDYHIFLR